MTEVEAFEKELKDFIVSVTWSHKYLISQFDVDSRHVRCLKRLKALFLVITSGGTVGLLSEYGQEATKNVLVWISLVASISSTILEAIDKASHLEEHAAKCQSLANDYCDIRDDCKHLLYALNGGGQVEPLAHEFENLREKRKAYNRIKPSVSRRAERLAEKKLKKNKDEDYRDDYKIFGLEE